MPQKICAPDLQNICLRNIAQNMDKHWAADYKDNFHNQMDVLHLVGPFEYFTSALIQKLIDVMIATKTLRHHHFQLLIHARIEKVDLSKCTIGTLDKAVKIIGQRCDKLKVLNLANRSNVSAKTLVQVIPEMFNLVTLNLEGTKANDQLLQFIAKNLKSIQDLNVLGCPVTDTGIINLCMDFTNENPKCSLLRKLILSSGHLTRKSAIIALGHLPSLEYLHHPSIMEALTIIHGDAFVSGAPIAVEDTHKIRNLTLSGLDSITSTLTEKCFDIAATYCPNVTEVVFHHEITNNMMSHLSRFKYLNSLELAGSNEDDPSTVNFEDGLLPLLCNIGKQLVKLNVVDMNKFDLDALGHFCPNLRVFHYTTMELPTVEFSEHFLAKCLNNNIKTPHKPFCYLNQLQIVIMMKNCENLSEAKFIRLFNNCQNLQDLHLSGLPSFTDAIFDTILDLTENLKNVNTLQLYECDNISDVPIWRVVQSDSMLKTLYINHCNHFTRQIYTSMLQYIKTSCLDLKLTCMEWKGVLNEGGHLVM
ncbi:unnamed protein product [Owenia fusiformis]|uniref:Uncharacterized protein n=1 Tax=Owenia fusiformis TaxID=6347 RepID=A0A8S4NS52_OWEFU|nr:unnamed protein product [Owenia fusiformis]